MGVRLHHSAACIVPTFLSSPLSVYNLPSVHSSTPPQSEPLTLLCFIKYSASFHRFICNSFSLPSSTLFLPPIYSFLHFLTAFFSRCLSRPARAPPQTRLFPASISRHH